MRLEYFQTKLEQANHYLLIFLFFAFPISLTVASSIPYLCALIYLICGHYEDQWQIIKRNPIVIVALLLFGLILIGTVYTEAPSIDMWRTTGKYSKLVLMVLLISAINEGSLRKKCLNAFIASCLFILISSYLNVWIDLPWSKTHTHGWGTGQAVIGDYITQNITMSFALAITLHRTFKSSDRIFQIFWGISSLLIAISMTHLSLGRTGYLLLIATTIISIFNHLQGSKKWWGLFIASIATAAITLSSPTVIERIQLGLHESQSLDGSIGYRVYTQSTTLHLGLEKPLLGWGTGAFQTVFAEYADKKFMEIAGAWHPHNQYIFFFFENGIIALSLFIALIFSITYLAKRQDDFHPSIIYCFVATLAINSFFNCSLWSGRESHFFIIALALLASSYQPKKHPLS